MKINFFKFFITFFSVSIFIILYLSIAGIETKKFNQQIKDKVVQSNKDLKIDLNSVNLTLDPLKFRINAKTIGAKIYYLNRALELEYIKTNVSIKSIFKNKLVSSNFEIVSKLISLKDFVKLSRSITFRPELIILETIIKDGHISLNLNFNLDENGKIKNDYEVKGTLKDGKIKFLKEFDVRKINFLFNIKKKKYIIKDIKFSSDKVDFDSDLLKIVKIDKSYLIEGKLQNSKSVLPKKIIKFLNLNIKNFDIENTKFSSNNNFEFQINRRFKLQNLKINSQINFNQITYKEENNFLDYFPGIKKKFLLNNHNLKIKYDKGTLLINGEGKVKNGNYSDQIEYIFSKKNKEYEFETNLNIKKTTLKNNKILKIYFPQTKDLLDVINHNVNIKYKDKKLYFTGKGDVIIEKELDTIEYFVIKDKDDYEIDTDFNLKKISLKNQNIFKTNFPLTKELIDLKDHKLNIKYKKRKLYLKGEGDIRFEKKFNKIKYSLFKNKDFFHLKSEVDIQNLNLKNQKIYKKFFPSTQDQLNLKNHKIKINVQKNLISFSGEGKIKIDDEYDNINYFMSKENGETNFDIFVNLNKTDFQIENLNYKKNNNFTTKLNISGSISPGKKLILNNFSVLDEKNKIQITNFVFDKDNLLIGLDQANFDYTDTENRKNLFAVSKKETNNYNLNGLFFNANTLITNLLKSDDERKNKFFKNNINIILKINEVYLDEFNSIKNLNGSLFIKNNKVLNANLSANFDNSNNIIFKINTKNNQKITKLYSSKAKPIVNRYKFIKGFDEGYLDFISTKNNDKSFSNLKIYNFKLKELPILTKLLTLASLQGIADILTGEGIRFDEFEMKFNNNGNLMTIDEIYAIGPAISILMNGYVEKKKLISLRGTLVPATTINKTISKIPVLGKILVGKKTGEGVFGVSFKIKGPPKNLETTVNPIKTLTPRFITRTLDKLKN